MSQGAAHVLDGVRTVAVLRALKLGDMLVAVPALRALRVALPDVRVSLVGLSWAREFAERFGRYVDDFVELPGWPGFPEAPLRTAAVPGFLGDVQGRGIDLVLQLHGAGTVSNPLAVLLGGRRTAGFYEAGGWCPDPELFLRFDPGEHELRRLLRLVAHLGALVADERLEFPLGDRDEEDLDELLAPAGLTRGEYVCMHPGATSGRRWPVRRFAAVAEGLARLGLQVVLTGTGPERVLSCEVANAADSGTVDLAGRTALGALGALLAHARLFVGNDTGVAHLAGAVGVPGVVLFEPDRVARWAPSGPSRLQVAHQSASPAHVLRMVGSLLEDTRPGRPTLEVTRR